MNQTSAHIARHVEAAKREAKPWVEPAARRIGHVARGAVIGTIGIFLVMAAWTHDPGEAIGL